MSSAFDHIQWYFRVSHPYMTLNAYIDAPRPTHQETLEDAHDRKDYVVDVLTTCRRIMDIVRVGIEREEFLEDTLVRATIETILSETRNMLQYSRQRRKNGLDIPSSSLLLLF